MEGKAIEEIPEKKVIVSAEKIKERLNTFKVIRYVPVPELKDEDSDVIPNFKVRMASLDDQVQARELSSKPMRIILNLLKRARAGEEITTKTIYTAIEDISSRFNQKTLMEAVLLRRNVLDPKFKGIHEALKFCQTNPRVVNRVVTFILSGEDN